jgi:hypothetical protein
LRSLALWEQHRRGWRLISQVSGPDFCIFAGVFAGPEGVNLRHERFVPTGPLNPDLPPLQARPQAPAVRQQQTLESVNMCQHSHRYPREGSFVSDSAR